MLPPLPDLIVCRRNAINDSGGSLLDERQRLRKDFCVSLVELDVVSAVSGTVESECPADSKGNGFRLSLKSGLGQFLPAIVAVQPLVC